MFNVPTNKTLLAHWMGWFAPGRSNRLTRYQSTDPGVIRAQVDCAAALGVRGFIATWQGPTVNPLLHQATLQMYMELASRGMLFALLLDPWLTKNTSDATAATKAAMNDTSVQAMLNGPAYLPERYVLDFGVGADWTKITSPATIVPLQKHVGFGWPETTNTMNQLSIDNSNPAMRVPAIFGWFNDGGYVSSKNGTRDYNVEVWDSSKPCRVVPAEGGNTFLDSVATLPSGQSAPYVAIVTWNDHDEQTAIEQFASAYTGIRIGK